MDKHFGSDGNGGYVISKQALATLVSFLTIIGVLVGLFGSAMALQSDYTKIKDSVEQLEEETKEICPLVVQNKEDIAVMRSTIGRIDRNVQKLIDGG